MNCSLRCVRRESSSCVRIDIRTVRTVKSSDRTENISNRIIMLRAIVKKSVEIGKTRVEAVRVMSARGASSLGGLRGTCFQSLATV